MRLTHVIKDSRQDNSRSDKKKRRKKRRKLNPFIEEEAAVDDDEEEDYVSLFLLVLADFKGSQEDAHHA